MDSAVFGFIGVIAGAVTTGGVQYLTGWLGRRNDSLVAARLVAGELIDAELTIDAAMEHGRPKVGDTGDRLFDRHQAVWEAQRDRLGRVLSNAGFHLVQASFTNLKHIDDVFERARLANDDDTGRARLRADPNQAGRMDTLRAAEGIALNAGKTWRDHFGAESSKRSSKP